MAQKCVHKGCGKVFTDPDEPCTYHPGPPVFHEGQKGWQCCKPRYLTFDEFLSIPPCTTGKHSTVDDTPAPPPKPGGGGETPTLSTAAPSELEIAQPVPAVARIPTAQQPRASPSPAPPPESEDDDPDIAIPDGKTCRRRGCGVTYVASGNREGEKCVHHPGAPIFHEGSKGYSCCKRRVLEFDQFMKIEGCKTKERHMFVGSGGKKGKSGQQEEEKLESVRHDFYQTSTSVIASLYLKKIDAATSKVAFTPSSVSLDLHTADRKRYTTDMELYGPIDPEKSTFKIMGTKLELTLVKTDGIGWPVLRAEDPTKGEIIQAGRAGRV